MISTFIGLTTPVIWGIALVIVIVFVILFNVAKNKK
jgi:hypothetical protein